MKKIELCKHWQAWRCDRSTFCTYAHGEWELGTPQPRIPRTPDQRQGLKIAICKFDRAGRCLRGTKCMFAHGDAELGTTQKAAC